MTSDNPSAPNDTQERTYNPLIPPDRDDPFPYYHWSQRERPIAFMPSIGAWTVTRYDDIMQVLNDPIRFSSAAAVPPAEAVNPPEVMKIVAGPLGPGVQRNLLLSDPPQHGELRAVANRLMRGQRINAMRPVMRDIANELVDSFEGDGRADLVSQFSHWYVRRVMAKVVGIPDEDVECASTGAAGLFALISPGLPDDVKIAAAHDFMKYSNLMLDLVRSRREDPQDDMISELVHIDDLPGTPLTDAEAVTLLQTLFGAGLDTTRDAINSAVYTMLSDRRHWERACEDPGAIPELLEETLRRDAPHRGLLRVATQDTEVGGVPIAAGSLLLLLFGAANRDATHFPDPDAFTPGRPEIRRHLAFGHGIHLCVGAHQARTEGRVALEVLTGRLPDMRLEEGMTPEYLPSFWFRGLQRLPVVW